MRSQFFAKFIRSYKARYHFYYNKVKSVVFPFHSIKFECVLRKTTKKKKLFKRYSSITKLVTDLWTPCNRQYSYWIEYLIPIGIMIPFRVLLVRKEMLAFSRHITTPSSTVILHYAYFQLWCWAIKWVHVRSNTCILDSAVSQADLILCCKHHENIPI